MHIFKGVAGEGVLGVDRIGWHHWGVTPRVKNWKVDLGLSKKEGQKELLKGKNCCLLLNIWTDWNLGRKASSRQALRPKASWPLGWAKMSHGILYGKIVGIARPITALCDTVPIVSSHMLLGIRRFHLDTVSLPILPEVSIRFVTPCNRYVTIPQILHLERYVDSSKLDRSSIRLVIEWYRLIDEDWSVGLIKVTGISEVSQHRLHYNIW